MANRSRVPPIVPRIFLLAATLGALFSVGWLLEGLWFSATAHVAQGTVRDLTNPEAGQEGRRAVVEFQVGNRTVAVRSQVAWDPPAYRVGQTVRVLYPPGQPERGRVSSFWEHVPAILAGVLAVVFGAVSAAAAGDEPESTRAARPGATPRARRAGCLLYVGAFSLGGLGLATAGIARLIALGGAGGVSSFFLLAGLCLLLFCGYQLHGLWAGPGPAPAGLAPGGTLAWELPRDRPGRVGLGAVGLFALLWNGSLAGLLVELLRGGVHGWAPFVIGLLVAGGLLGLGLLALLIFMAPFEFPAILGARPPRVEVSDQPFEPGGTGEVLVVQPGPVRFRAWQALLVCEHQGVFERGEDAPTETRLLHREELLRQDGLVIEPGMPAYTARRVLHVPEGAPASRRTEGGMICWKIVVKGRSGGRRPGFTFEFPLTVTERKSCGEAGGPLPKVHETGPGAASE